MFRGIFISLFVIATPAFAQTPIEEPSDAAGVYCAMVYQPATCTIHYGAEDYISQASNACEALANLVTQVRSAAHWFVDPANDVIAGAICTADPE